MKKLPAPDKRGRIACAKEAVPTCGCSGFLCPSFPRGCTWCSLSIPPSRNPSAPPTLNPCIWAVRSDADALFALLRLCNPPPSCIPAVAPVPIGAGLACLGGAPTEGGPERVLAGEGMPRLPRGLGVAVLERGIGAGDSARCSAAASCRSEGASSSRLALREWL